MLAALSRVLEARDPSSRGHTDRVTALARVLAYRLGWDDARIAALDTGARLHDIGKVIVPGAILRKPGPLDADEIAQIRRHPEVGARLVRPLALSGVSVACILYHHERWDGRGYPFGMRGDEIPLEARVLAVADAYDAMTSFRPYRPALSPADALGEVERCAGSQFDPELARAFAAVCDARAVAV
jgi:HD-GYP domain-containing protein (c-di-GMP phosphodiesterase class II)